MAKIKYELTIVEGMQVEKLQFESHIVNLFTDQDPSDPLKFKNKKDIDVYPDSSKMKIVALTRNGIIASQWCLVVKVNGIEIPASPITQSTDSNGRTDYTGYVVWH